MNRREFLQSGTAMGLIAAGGLTWAAGKNSQPNSKEQKMQFVTFNDGNKMPILGYGVYQIPPEQTQQCVEDAISVGLIPPKPIAMNKVWAMRCKQPLKAG